MQSTGQTSTHELSFLPMQGSAMTYAMRRRILRASVNGAQAPLPSKERDGQDQLLAVPTEHHRARALEANARVRTARTMAGATCGIALLAMAPFVGWWFLLLFGVIAAVMLTADRRIERSERPELVIALDGLVVLTVLAVGTALSGGEDSPALPWMVLPVALRRPASARRW